MSSISPDPRIDRAALEPLGGQVALDDLRRQGQGADQVAAPQTAELAPPPAIELDPGEAVLKVLAWEGVPDGQRLLAGDAGFERALGALELSQAADRGAESVLDALG